MVTYQNKIDFDSLNGKERESFYPTFAPSSILVSAKRSPIERKGVHAWHPYYAGYSEAFVDSAIEFLGCTSKSIILDPWGGSGTTSIVAARKGIASLSADINPVMARFSSAKSIEALSTKNEIKRFFEDTPWSKLDKAQDEISNTTSSIYEPKTAAYIRSIIESIPHPNFKKYEGSIYSSSTIKGIRPETSIINPSHAFSMAVLFTALRRLTNTAKLANPTWHRVESEKIAVDEAQLETYMRTVSNEMLSSLEAFYSYSSDPKQFYSLLCDVRCLPLESESIDFVITSPPYLTRIDYAVSTSPELSLFGDESLITEIRHKTIGAPVITKNEKEQRAVWGNTCNSILDAIANHSGKASKTYYWKNITQYFMDIDDSLEDIFRVMKSGASGLVVVQSSYFKEIEIPLGEIYVEMAKAKGFDAKIAFREEVKGHMAHVNTRSNIYKMNKIYYEDAVHITKR